MPKNFKYNVIQLIENVRLRPSLWDRTLDGYKNREERKNYWEEIFRDLEPRYDDMSWEEKHTTGEIILNKWTNLRDTFVKTLKPKMGKPKKQYVFHRELSFLLKVIPEEEYANTEFNMDDGTELKQEIVVEEPSHSSRNVSEKSRRVEIDSDEDYAPRKSKRTKRTKSQDINYINFEAEDASNDIAFDPSNVNGRLMNEDEAFFASLLPTVVRYNEDERLEFRIEVLALMRKIKQTRNWKVGVGN